jgi:superfamily I DNA and/or RNA helicase
MKMYLLYHRIWHSVKVKIIHMNVGMTRARRKLLLVGDSSTLCRHPFFVELLAYVKGVGGYRTAIEMGKQA